VVRQDKQITDPPIALTFGSFYFVPVVQKSARLRSTDFFETVRRCLRGVEGVDEVHVDPGPETDAEGHGPRSNRGHIERGLPRTALEFLFFEIRSEIDLYYQMNELAREQLHGWADISDAVTNLTTIERKRGRWAAASQALRPRRLTRDASISLTEFAARRQMTNAAVDRQLRQTYSGGTQRFAQELLDGEAGDRQDYPIEQFSQLLNMFEAGHVLEMQLLVAFAASLIGAAIGAGATLLAAG